MNEHNKTIYVGEKHSNFTIRKKSFTTHGYRNKHIMSIHTGAKAFKCEYCDQCFSDKSNMKRHKASIH